MQLYDAGSWLDVMIVCIVYILCLRYLRMTNKKPLKSHIVRLKQEIQKYLAKHHMFEYTDSK